LSFHAPVLKQTNEKHIKVIDFPAFFLFFVFYILKKRSRTTNDFDMFFIRRFWIWPMKISARPSSTRKNMSARPSGTLKKMSAHAPRARAHAENRSRREGWRDLLTRQIAQRREGGRARGCVGGTVAAAR